MFLPFFSCGSFHLNTFTTNVHKLLTYYLSNFLLLLVLETLVLVLVGIILLLYHSANMVTSRSLVFLPLIQYSLVFTVTTFVVSTLVSHENKLDMVHVQNSTLAGGVAAGTVCNLLIGPHGAVLIGIVSGAVSVLGYRYLSVSCLHININTFYTQKKKNLFIMVC